MDGGFSAFYITGFTAGEILGEGGVVIFDITVLCEPRGKVRTSDESGIRHNFQNAFPNAFHAKPL